MPFSYSSSGISMNKNFAKLPKGEYGLRIINTTAKQTKKGDPMVSVDFEVCDGPYAGEILKYHNVTFFVNKESPGAFMSVHFLKSIGQPWEGDFDVDEGRWLGKKLLGFVATEKDFNGVDRNVIKSVKPYTGTEVFKGADPFKKQAAPIEDETVPF